MDNIERIMYKVVDSLGVYERRGSKVPVKVTRRVVSSQT